MSECIDTLVIAWEVGYGRTARDVNVSKGKFKSTQLAPNAGMDT